MQVRLRKKKIAKGVISYYLDYHYHGERVRDTLKLYLYPGKTIDNQNTKELAEKIRAQRQHEITSGNFGIIAAHKKKTDFIKYMQAYVDAYKKKDINKYKAVLNSFKNYLNVEAIPCSAISERIMQGFKDYLYDATDKEGNPLLNGETPGDYWKVTNRMLKAAVKDGLFKSNPAEGIKNGGAKQNQLTKQVLTSNEIKLLAETLCGNDEVKRAFLFSTQTGMRPGDMRKLKWKHVFTGGEFDCVDFEQSKTHFKNGIPLNSNAVQLLGERGEVDELVFKLPTTEGMNKVIKNWVNRAGIQKHITSYCGRHSVATNLLDHGLDIVIISKVLGHTSTKHTQKYTHVNDKMKQKAVNKLPKIKWE